MRRNAIWSVPVNTSIVLLAMGILAISLTYSLISNINNLSRAFENDIDISFAYLLNSDAQTLEAAQEHSFIPSELNRKKVWFGKRNDWYQITLKNARNYAIPSRLVLDNPTFDFLAVHQTDQELNLINTSRFGDEEKNVVLAQRMLPNIRFTMAPYEQVTFWLHLQTQGSAFLPISILEEPDFTKYQRNLYVTWGFLIGIVVLMAVYNLVLFIGIRDMAYLYYVGYLLSLLLVLGVIHGFGYLLFPMVVQCYLSKAIIFLHCLGFFYALKFAVAYLRITPSHKQLYSLSRGTLLLIAAFGIIALFIPEHIAAQLFIIVQGVAYAVVFRLIIFDIKKRFRWTRYYIISWLPIFFGAAIGFSLFSGLVPFNFYTRHALLITAIFEMALISMALAERMNESENRRMFEATHDAKTGFGNEILLEQTLKISELGNNNQTVALVSVRIANFSQIAPYLIPKDLTKLLQLLANNFIDEFHSKIGLLNPNSDKTFNPTQIDEQSLAFLVSSPKLGTIEKTLKDLSQQGNFNPAPDLFPYPINCRFGIVVLHDFINNPEGMISGVKRALSFAEEKQLGIFNYRPLLHEKNDRKIRLLQDLDQAIDNNQLELVHQPKLTLDHQNDVHSEVLLRWHHKELGDVSPNEFIGIAEETSLINKLTLWVLENAFKQLTTLKQDCGEDTCISINISAIDLSRADFHRDVVHLAERYKVAPKNITLEVTETTNFSDQQRFKTNLQQLKKNGFKLAIDDFGTGFCSLTYVSAHPFDEIKIDRSFIKKMGDDSRQNLIVSTTINMAKKLGLAVTAEGVEDEVTLDMLKALNCPTVQGYLHAKPMSLDCYLTWLSNRDALQA